MEPDWKIDTAVPCFRPFGFPGRGPGGLTGEHQHCLQPLRRSCVSLLCASLSSVVLASAFLLQEDSPSSAGLEEKGFVVLERCILVFKLLFPQQNTSFPPFETLELSFLLPKVL